MSFWRALLDRLQAVRLDLEKRVRPTDPASSVDFSIAFIALAAKLAKADGLVLKSEVVMFRKIFDIPPEDEDNAARVYNLCLQETAGYEFYARRIWRLIRGHENEETIRTNLLDGLFHIAMADGVYHPEENKFLLRVSEILELADQEFQHFRARHVPQAWCPYRVLGLSPGADPTAIRAAWRLLVRQNHPDLLVSRGLPHEMLLMAESRIKDINRAYDELTEASDMSV
jgi:DnaJ like chaperone protein